MMIQATRNPALWITRHYPKIDLNHIAPFLKQKGWMIPLIPRVPIEIWNNIILTNKIYRTAIFNAIIIV